MRSSTATEAPELGWRVGPRLDVLEELDTLEHASEPHRHGTLVPWRFTSVAELGARDAPPAPAMTITRYDRKGNSTRVL